MTALGTLVATVAAFVLSSADYAALSPLESRRLGDRTPDRGSVRPWQIASELVRTAIVAGGFAWVAGRSGLLGLPGGLGLAALLWAMFPVVVLLGSVTWERVHPITAALHAGDWLLKLLLVAVVVGLLH